MTLGRLKLGKSGEDVACRSLKKNGYKILERNYRSPYGEIDIIALDKDKKTLSFIEVKTRSSNEYGEPSEAVNRKKQEHIIKASLAYLQKLDGSDASSDRLVRYDVVSVLSSKEGKGAVSVDIIKDAFGADGF